METSSSALTPSLLAEPMTPAQILFGLRGRIARGTWWLWGVAALLGGAIGGAMLLAIAGVPMETASLAMNLLVLWPAVATSVKRWHDRDKSGWWVLINFVPVIGLLWVLVENGLLRGTKGPNRFGDDPTGRL